MGRRLFMWCLGVAVGVLAFARARLALALGPEEGPAEGAVAGPPPEPSRRPAGQVEGAGRETFATLRVGDRVGRWTLVAIHAERLGAVPIVLQSPGGGRFQVDVLRRDGRPARRQGVSATAGLSLYLSNRGDGQTVTDEEQGLGAMALAARLRDLEANGIAFPQLLSHEERRERHPLGAYCVPLR